MAHTSHPQLRHHHLTPLFPPPPLPQLVGLELHKNDLGCGGAAAIAKSLSGGAAPLLIYLGLSTNGIGDEGARHLAAMLRSNAVVHMERLNLQVSEQRHDVMPPY